MSRDDLHFRLRIPEKLKEQIEKAANEKRRSMTAEIVDRLEETVRQDHQLSKGLDFRHMIGEYEEAISERDAIQEKYDRGYIFDRFDAVKDEILAAIENSKK